MMHGVFFAGTMTPEVINKAYGEKLRSSTQEGNAHAHYYKYENNASGRELRPTENEMIMNLLRSQNRYTSDQR
jgi:hypothetical protein